MASSFTFFVPGIPQPGGSKRGFPFRRRDGRIGVAISDDNAKAKSWKALVALAAQEAGVTLVADPVEVTMTFWLPRPKGHFGSGKNAAFLKPSAPHYHTVRPDVLKLARSTEDALTGIAWNDDAGTPLLHLGKRYISVGEVPGCRITILLLDQEKRP